MARRFVFELEPVLEQRKRLEEVRQREVAALERERIAIEEVLKGFQRSIASAKDDLRERLGPGGMRDASLHALRLQMNASLHLTTRAQRAVLELAGLHKRLDAARGVLLQATTARKAVELLRTKRYEAWRRDQERREAAELDEMAVMRAGRRTGDAESAGDDGGERTVGSDA